MLHDVRLLGQIISLTNICHIFEQSDTVSLNEHINKDQNVSDLPFDLEKYALVL